MRIDIITKDAKGLKSKIFKSIGNPLETWKIRKTGNPNEQVLTPVANQYIDVVILILEVNVNNDKLTVRPSYWNGKEKPSEAVKAIILGMFTATLLTHFSINFSKLETTN